MYFALTRAEALIGPGWFKNHLALFPNPGRFCIFVDPKIRIETL